MSASRSAITMSWVWGAPGLDFTDGAIALEPFDAFLFFDGFMVALVPTARLGFVSCPALDIEQAEWGALRRKRHGVVQQKPYGFILDRIDGAEALGFGVARVVKGAGILDHQDDFMVRTRCSVASKCGARMASILIWSLSKNRYAALTAALVAHAWGMLAIGIAKKDSPSCMSRSTSRLSPNAADPNSSSIQSAGSRCGGSGRVETVPSGSEHRIGFQWSQRG